MILRGLNLFHKARSSIPERWTYGLLNLKFRGEALMGLLRGVGSVILGRVRFEGTARPLLLGKRTEFQIEPGGRITLAAKESQDDQSVIYMPVKEASAIGTYTHWKFMNPPVSRSTRIRLQRNAELKIGSNTLIMPGAYLSVWPGKTLEFGSNVTIGNELYVSTKHGLKVGRGNMWSHQVKIMDYDGHPIFKNGETDPLEDRYGGTGEPIIIEDDVWIGFRATLLKGIRVGRGAIIGANSCVTQDVPAFSAVAGNPARIIARDVSWQRF